MNGQPWEVFSEHLEGLAHSIARKTARKGPEALSKGMHELAFGGNLLMGIHSPRLATL